MAVAFGVGFHRAYTCRRRCLIVGGDDSSVLFIPDFHGLFGRVNFNLCPTSSPKG